MNNHFIEDFGTMDRFSTMNNHFIEDFGTMDRFSTMNNHFNDGWLLRRRNIFDPMDGNSHPSFSRVAPYIDEKKGKILYNTFIMSNFNYCPLVWMFCGKTQNKEIDRVHKRALRILLEDYTSSFDELLQKIDDTRVHVKNLRNLMVENIQVLIVRKSLLYVEYFPAKRAWV